MVGIKAAKAATKVGIIAPHGHGILPKTVHQHGLTTHTTMHAAKAAKATNVKRHGTDQHGLPTNPT